MYKNWSDDEKYIHFCYGKRISKTFVYYKVMDIPISLVKKDSFEVSKEV